MKIKFKKKRLRYFMAIGILWLIFGVIAVIFFSDNIFNYGYLLLGILYFSIYLFEHNKQYLTIEDGTISKNHLIPKKINLKDIKSIKLFAGDYKLKTDTDELIIDTKFIDEKSLIDLETVLKSLNLEIN
ncbi:hypothetical protein [Gelidibacter pelagius]|uniref:PH (Pleckstrin Homology) domain-containing protein n=1 Tax=Gelidibacter pelagius TaxID=2819985 RepID=A0ABS3SWL4_9FLAO|nr:hypothetical protein [Gelidibacter pelagius]MBO3100091.1 hypothetical protein [Gelidibacter pelagius]